MRTVAGAIALIVGLAGISYPIIWQHHQNVVGHQLIARDRSRAKALESITANGQVCTPTPGPGVMVIPALGLTAPVSQGLSDSVLAVALGHDPTTAWPGPGSMSLIAGHDVGYLSQDTQLRVGDVLEYKEPCATLNYKVIRHLVSRPGGQVAPVAGGGLVLDSCWPTNALWYTPDRYLVVAQYVSLTPSSLQVSGVPSSPSVPRVQLPIGLSPQEVSLSTNSWTMGTLTMKGTPTALWSQSQDALVAEKNALELFFGLRHALDTSNSAWLSALAPGIQVPSWLADAPASSLEVTEWVSGLSLVQVQLSSTVATSSGDRQFVVTASSHSNLMSIFYIGF